MPIWTQNLIVALLLIPAGGYVIWQMARTLRGKAGGAGSCCSKGCGQSPSQRRDVPRTVFIPVESLIRKK